MIDLQERIDKLKEELSSELYDYGRKYPTQFAIDAYEYIEKGIGETFCEMKEAMTEDYSMREYHIWDWLHECDIAGDYMDEALKDAYDNDNRPDFSKLAHTAMNNHAEYILDHYSDEFFEIAAATHLRAEGYTKVNAEAFEMMLDNAKSIDDISKEGFVAALKEAKTVLGLTDKEVGEKTKEHLKAMIMEFA